MSNRDEQMVKMRLLVESWGLADLVNHLEANDVEVESLPGLDDEMITELFPSIGKRSKFRMCLRQYLETYDLPEVAEASETSDKNEPFQVLDSSELMLPDEMCGEYVMENQTCIQQPTTDPLQDPIEAYLAYKMEGKVNKRKKSVLTFPAPLPVLSSFLEHHRAQGTLKSQRRAFINECCNHLILLTNGTPTPRDYLTYSCTIVQKFKEFRDENSFHPAESFQNALSHMIRNRRLQARKKYDLRLPETPRFQNTSALPNAASSKVVQSESSISHETRKDFKKIVPVTMEKLLMRAPKYIKKLANTTSTSTAPLPGSAAQRFQRAIPDTAFIPKAPQPESSISIDDTGKIQGGTKTSKPMVLVTGEKAVSLAAATTHEPEQPAEDPNIKKILETVTLLLTGHQETKIFMEMQLKKIQEQTDLIDQLKKENEQLKQKQKQKEQQRKKRKCR